MAVVLIAALVGYAAYQDSQLTDERARNTELQNKIDSLEKEVSTLKETADNYFQRGADAQLAGNLEEAKTAFENVISKFPSSNLAAKAQERLIYVNSAIAHNQTQGAGKADKGTK
jgi:TolA-binding protein